MKKLKILLASATLLSLASACTKDKEPVAVVPVEPIIEDVIDPTVKVLKTLTIKDTDYPAVFNPASFDLVKNGIISVSDDISPVDKIKSSFVNYAEIDFNKPTSATGRKVRVRVEDEAGNLTFDQVNLVIEDTTAPSIEARGNFRFYIEDDMTIDTFIQNYREYIALNDNYTRNADITVGLNYSNLSGNTAAAGLKTLDSSVIDFTKAGQYVVEYIAADEAGNKTAPTPITFTVVNKPKASAMTEDQLYKYIDQASVKISTYSKITIGADGGLADLFGSEYGSMLGSYFADGDTADMWLPTSSGSGYWVGTDRENNLGYIATNIHVINGVSREADENIVTISMAHEKPLTSPLLTTTPLCGRVVFNNYDSSTYNNIDIAIVEVFGFNFDSRTLASLKITPRPDGLPTCVPFTHSFSLDRTLLNSGLLTEKDLAVPMMETVDGQLKPIYNEDGSVRITSRYSATDVATTFSRSGDLFAEYDALGYPKARTEAGKGTELLRQFNIADFAYTLTSDENFSDLKSYQLINVMPIATPDYFATKYIDNTDVNHLLDIKFYATGYPGGKYVRMNFEWSHTVNYQFTTGSDGGDGNLQWTYNHINFLGQSGPGSSGSAIVDQYGTILTTLSSGLTNMPVTGGVYFDSMYIQFNKFCALEDGKYSDIQLCNQVAAYNAQVAN